MSEKKQVFKNAFVNILSLSMRMLVGIWLVPYLVKHIGAAAYGFVPIAAILTEYISVVTNSVNQAISRYLVIDIQKKDWKKANKTFNTSFFSIVGIILIQLPIVFIVLRNFDSIFSVPAELFKDVYTLFLLSITAFLISVFSTIFNTSMYAHNRIDLMRLLDILRIGTRVTTIILLFSIDTPKLYYVGIGEVLAAIIIFFVSMYNWRKLTPKLHIKISDFEKEKLMDMMSMAGWLVVNYVGMLLFIKIDLIVVNRYIGAESAGQYASILQWSNLIRTVIGIFSFLTGPLVLAAYAKKDYQKIKHILLTSMKILGVLVSLAVGVLIVLSKPLLTIWIGEEIAEQALLLKILVVHLSVNLAVIPLFSINTAMNKVKLPGIVTLSAGVLNFILAVLLATKTELGIYGVAIAGMIVLTLKNAVFTPIYASKILDIKWTTFFQPIWQTTLTMIFIVALGFPLQKILKIDSYIELIVVGLGLIIVAFPFIWRIALSKADREFGLNMLPENIRGKLKWLN